MKGCAANYLKYHISEGMCLLNHIIFLFLSKQKKEQKLQLKRKDEATRIKREMVF